jgi:hypothetical protein
MNPSETDDTLSEQELDQLLHEFFAQEMPRELAEPRPAISVRIAPRETSPQRSRSAAAAVAAMACVLGIVAFLARSDSPTSPLAAETQPETPSATSPLPDWDNGEIIERKTLLTEQGPVEERSHLKYRRVTVEDPETGRKVEVLLPELEIELRPLDESPPVKLPE